MSLAGKILEAQKKYKKKSEEEDKETSDQEGEEDKEKKDDKDKEKEGEEVNKEEEARYKKTKKNEELSPEYEEAVEELIQSAKTLLRSRNERDVKSGLTRVLNWSKSVGEQVDLSRDDVIRLMPR